MNKPVKISDPIEWFGTEEPPTAWCKVPGVGVIRIAKRNTHDRAFAIYFNGNITAYQGVDITPCKRLVEELVRGRGNYERRA